MARRTRSRCYIREARRQRKLLKKFVEKGNVNNLHLVAMLDAEAAAFNGDYKNAKKCWESALLLSRGFLHHTALAFERYGEFLYHEMGDPLEAAFRIDQAVKAYREWGCVAKVNILVAKYGSIISTLSSDDLWFSTSFPSILTEKDDTSGRSAANLLVSP
mmetsp:Transcript_5705/g.10620  ORF Transcript_5705/g.10620 Transcript_5705/m.10620 type:complete len:160 (-) Transcript_5705:70-549(-)